jgi:hypothetical protein
MKLGEALIEAGLITRQQLGIALERQTVIGGRIDTNIVELRFLSDEKLTGFLGKFLRLPVVTAEALNSIPDEVITILGKEMVENYMLIPFALERQRLHVGMLNPKNFRDIENLRFTTGYEIIPYVITETRLLYALEKYYGIKRETRYISLIDRFDPDSKTDDLSQIIQRISGDSSATQKDYGKEPGQKKEVRYPETGENRRATVPGLTEAVLLNAIYTAKLYFSRLGSLPVDGSVEDEVLANWERLAAKLRKEEKDH